MADGIRFDVSGLDGIRNKMAQVKNEVNYKGGRAALRRAANVLRDQAQSNARRVDDHETETAIWKNVAVRWNGRAFKRNGVLAFRLGVLGGAQAGRAAEKGASNPGGITWYWRMLEFGTSKMAAQPIFRPVPDQAGQKAVDVFARSFNQALDRVLAKRGAA